MKSVVTNYEVICMRIKKDGCISLKKPVLKMLTTEDARRTMKQGTPLPFFLSSAISFFIFSIGPVLGDAMAARQCAPKS